MTTKEYECENNERINLIFNEMLQLYGSIQKNEILNLEKEKEGWFTHVLVFIQALVDTNVIDFNIYFQNNNDNNNDNHSNEQKMQETNLTHSKKIKDKRYNDNIIKCFEIVCLLSQGNMENDMAMDVLSAMTNTIIEKKKQFINDSTNNHIYNYHSFLQQIAQVLFKQSLLICHTFWHFLSFFFVFFLLGCDILFSDPKIQKNKKQKKTQK